MQSGVIIRVNDNLGLYSIDYLLYLYIYFIHYADDSMSAYTVTHWQLAKPPQTVQCVQSDRQDHSAAAAANTRHGQRPSERLLPPDPPLRREPWLTEDERRNTK